MHFCTYSFIYAQESIENNRVGKCDEGMIEAVKQEITSHDASERKISELKWNNNELWKKNRKFEALVRTLEKQNKMKEEMDEVDLMLDVRIYSRYSALRI